jgi:hypothetical protein
LQTNTMESSFCDQGRCSQFSKVLSVFEGALSSSQDDESGHVEKEGSMHLFETPRDLVEAHAHCSSHLGDNLVFFLLVWKNMRARESPREHEMKRYTLDSNPWIQCTGNLLELARGHQPSPLSFSLLSSFAACCLRFCAALTRAILRDAPGLSAEMKLTHLTVGAEPAPTTAMLAGKNTGRTRATPLSGAFGAEVIPEWAKGL